MPDGQHNLAFYIKCLPSVGLKLVYLLPLSPVTGYVSDVIPKYATIHRQLFQRFLDLMGSYIGDLLSCGPSLFAPLAENQEGSIGLMAVWVRPTQTQFPKKCSFCPGGQHTLVCFAKGC